MERKGEGGINNPLTAIGEANHIPYSQLVGKPRIKNQLGEQQYAFFQQKSMKRKGKIDNSDSSLVSVKTRTFLIRFIAYGNECEGKPGLPRADRHPFAAKTSIA